LISTNQIALEQITTKILEKREELTHSVPLPASINKRNAEQLLTWRVQLVKVYAESISVDKDGMIQDLKEWSHTVSSQLVELTIPLDLALGEISQYRGIIGSMILKEATAHELSMDEFYHILMRFDDTVDQAIQLVSRSYMNDFKNTMQNASFAVNELSVPLVRVSESVGVIPIVGEIDTHRAQLLMDNALKQGNDYQLETIILELSGVSMIDTMVADQLIKVIYSLELIGIHAILTGIRPNIVQTMVSLGIDMRNVETYSSLHQAIESLHVLKNEASI
jgi:rsbT co-antagonist protein RsbR